MLHRWVQISLVMSGIWFVLPEDQQRFVLDSTTKSPDQVLLDLQKQMTALQQTNSALQKQLHNLNHSMTAQINHLKQQQHSTFIKWGQTFCSGHGASTVYSGYAAGPPYGAAASSVCLSSNTSWTYHLDGYSVQGGVLGAILYQVDSNFSAHAFHNKNLNGKIMPCTVCQVPRSAVVMVPGRSSCLSGWTMDYNGYLMGTSSYAGAGMDYVCVDRHAQTMPVQGNNTHYWKGMYLVEVRCGMLPCTTFKDGREVPCAMCSR